MHVSAESITVAQSGRRMRTIAPHIHSSVALLVGLTGAADIVAAYVPRTHLGDMLVYWPLAFEYDLRAFGVVIGVGLLFLAQGLARGKRHAWQLTILLLIASLLWQMTRGHVMVAIWLTLLMSLFLGSLAPFFRAKSDPPALWRGYAALAGGVLLVYLYALGGMLVLEQRLAPIESLESIGVSFQHLLDGVPLIHQHVPHAVRLWLFEQSLALSTCAAFFYGLVQILRPAVSRLHIGHDDHATLAELLRHHGANTLTAFARDPAKRTFLATTAPGAATYALADRIAIVAGDPIAAPDTIPAVLDDFAQWCRGHDLQPAFWHARDVHLPAYHAQGWQTLKIGEEAIIDLATFTLQGGAMQNVRTTLRHAEKAGVTVRFFVGTISDPALAAGVEALSDAWMATKGEREMGFSQGRWHDTYLTERVIGVAVAADGQPLAFTTFLPVPGRAGWALDHMRRDPHSVAGVMELLLVRACERFRATGTATLSLGLAPLANTMGEEQTRVGRWCGACASHFGANKRSASLMRFKRKFNPRWEARYLVYPRTLALPRVGWAILWVHVRPPGRAAAWRSRLATRKVRAA